MAFVKKTWKDRIAEFPTRRRLTKEDNTSELVTVAREEGTLSQEGDAFSAENMNDLENRIDAEFTEVNGKLDNKIQCIEYDVTLTQSQWAEPYQYMGRISTNNLKSDVISVTGDPQAPFSYDVRDNEIIFFSNAKHFLGQYFVVTK